VLAARPAHRLLLHLFLVGVGVEFYLAGAGVFGAHNFDPHRMLGTVLTVVALLVLITAALAHAFVAESGVLLVLMIVQSVLVRAGEDASAWIAALHPVNGAAILVVAFLLLRRTATR